MSRQRSTEVIQSSELVTIGELVRLTGMRYSTLKYYTEEEMLDFEQEEEKLTRRYKRENAIKRLELIKELKGKGMSVSQIKEYIISEN